MLALQRTDHACLMMSSSSMCQITHKPADGDHATIKVGEILSMGTLNITEYLWVRYFCVYVLTGCIELAQSRCLQVVFHKPPMFSVKLGLEQSTFYLLTLFSLYKLDAFCYCHIRWLLCSFTPYGQKDGLTREWVPSSGISWTVCFIFIDCSLFCIHCMPTIRWRMKADGVVVSPSQEGHPYPADYPQIFFTLLLWYILLSDLACEIRFLPFELPVPPDGGFHAAYICYANRFLCVEPEEVLM